MQIDQLPFKPGDIVRDRKTDIDYAVESIFGITAGAVAITAVGLYDDKVARWFASSAESMEDSHLVIINSEKLPVLTGRVHEYFREKFSEAIKNNQDVLNEILKPENIALRDLLLYGVAHSTNEKAVLNKAVVALAESITTITGNLPDEAGILKILQSGAPDSIPEKALSTFAKNIFLYAKLKSGTKKHMMSAGVLENILLNPEGGLGGDAFILMRGMGKRFSQQSNPRDPRYDLVRKLLLNPKASATADEGILKELFGETSEGLVDYNYFGKDRIRKIAERMFKSSGGQYSKETKSFVDTAAQGVIDLLNGKAVQEKYKGADLLLDALASWLLDKNLAPRSSRYIHNNAPRVEGITYHLPEELKNSRARWLASYSERAQQDFEILDGAKNQYTKLTGVIRPASTRQGFSMMEASKLIRIINDKKNNTFAISTDALFTSILGNSRIKINNIEGTLKDANIQEQLKNIEPFVIAKSSQLKLLHTQAKSADLTADLTPILESQGDYFSTLTERDRRILESTLINLRENTGNEAIIPLVTNKSNKYLYHVVKKEGGSFYTANIETAMEHRIADQEKSNISIYQLSNPSLYRSVVTAENKYGPGENKHGPGVSSNNKRLFYKIQESIKTDATPIRTEDHILEALRSKNRADYAQQLGIGQLDIAEVDNAFLRGYEATKLALATVRGKGSANKLTWLGSDINVPLAEQLKRASVYFEEGGLILDIETTRDISTGEAILKEIAFGDSATNKIVSMTEEKFSTYENQAESIISLVIDLEKQLKSKRVIGTAGPHDFDTLVASTRKLIQELPNTTLARSTQEELEKDLVSALASLEKIRKDNLFDVQSVYPFAGFAGVTRQSWVTSQLLDRPEGQLHTAEQDVTDLIEILAKLKARFKSNYSPESLESTKDLFIMGNSQLNPGNPSMIKKILGVKEFTDSSGKSRTSLLFEIFDSIKENDEYKLVSRHRVGEEVFDSNVKLAAFLEKYNHTFTESEFNTVIPDLGMSLGEMQKRASVDYAQRQLRSYNPFNVSRFGVDFEFNPRDLGDWGATQALLDAKTISLMPKVQQRYQAEVDRLLSLNSELAPANLHRLMMSEASWMDDLLDETGVATDYLLTDEAKKGYIGNRLRAIFNESSLATEKRYNMGLRQLNSSAGQQLINAAKHAVTMEGRAADRPGMYPFTYLFQEERLVAQQRQNIRAANKLSDIISFTEPRISLEIGQHEASEMIAGAANLEKDNLVKVLRTVASEEIASFIRHGSNESVQKALEGTQFGAAQLEQEFEKLKTDANLGDISLDLGKWKEALLQLSYADGKEQEFPAITAVKDTIVSQNSKTSFVNFAKERVAKLESLRELVIAEKGDVPEITGEIDTRLQSARNLVTQFEGMTEANVPKQASAILSDIHKLESADVFRDFLLKKPEIADLSDSEVASIGEEVSSFVDFFHRKLETERDDSVIYQGIELEHVFADLGQEQRYHFYQTKGSANRTPVGAVVGRLREIRELMEQGNQTLADILIAGNLRRKEVLEMHSAVGKAVVTATQEAADDLVPAVHQAVGDAGTPSLGSASKAFSRVSTPLLALGGIVGLLAANNPDTGDTFTMGNYSRDRASDFSGAEAQIAKYSEVPGNPDNQKIWYGTTHPFQLDISFKGFVNDRMQHDRLRREVYNIISNNMQVKKSSGEIQDRRNKEHRMAAVEALRGQI